MRTWDRLWGDMNGEDDCGGLVPDEGRVSQLGFVADFGGWVAEGGEDTGAMWTSQS